MNPIQETRAQGRTRAPGYAQDYQAIARPQPRTSAPVRASFDQNVMDRARNVYEATLRAVHRYVWSAIAEETGYGLKAVLQGIILGLLFSLVILGLTTAIGGALGAAAGFAVSFFAGGELAVPGAVAGGELGLDAGIALLNRLGLGMLVLFVASKLKDVLQPLAGGILFAWNAGPPEAPGHEASIDAAARQIARSAGCFVRAILEGIVAYLTAKGMSAVASRLLVLVRTLRSSGLGPDFADWVEAHHQELIDDPKLKEEPTAQEPKPAEPIIVNEMIFRNAMRGARLKTQQDAVSMPAVQRYVRMLEEGQAPPAIKVDGDIIVEGNHRYVAGRIFGKEPPTVPGARPPFKETLPTIDWSQVKLDPADWGNY